MSFPTVATVIGLSQDVADSGPLLATIALDPTLITPQDIPSQPVEIKAEDPVTQAVVDNIIGKLPTKKELVMLKCDVCNIVVSSKEVLEIHYAGSRHARKVKGQELIKEIKNSPSFSFVETDKKDLSTGFTCNVCSIKVNSYQQLHQHLAGTKHKNKADTNNSNTMEVSVSSDNNSDKSCTMAVNIRPNRLYCAACNVHVNSDLQLHQHITSTKHAKRINGESAGEKRKRATPYEKKPSAGGFVGKRNNGWTSSNSSYGLTSKCPVHVIAPNKTFVPGGMLSDGREY